MITPKHMKSQHFISKCTLSYIATSVDTESLLAQKIVQEYGSGHNSRFWNEILSQRTNMWQNRWFCCFLSVKLSMQYVAISSLWYLNRV